MITRSLDLLIPMNNNHLQVAGVVARAVVEPGRDIESLRGRMGESTRQVSHCACRSVDGLFESLLTEAFS